MIRVQQHDRFTATAADDKLTNLGARPALVENTLWLKVSNSYWVELLSEEGGGETSWYVYMVPMTHGVYVCVESIRLGAIQEVCVHCMNNFICCKYPAITGHLLTDNEFTRERGSGRD